MLLLSLVWYISQGALPNVLTCNTTHTLYEKIFITWPTSSRLKRPKWGFTSVFNSELDWVSVKSDTKPINQMTLINLSLNVHYDVFPPRPPNVSARWSDVLQGAVQIHEVAFWLHHSTGQLEHQSVCCLPPALSHTIRWGPQSNSSCPHLEANQLMSNASGNTNWESYKQNQNRARQAGNGILSSSGQR